MYFLIYMGADIQRYREPKEKGGTFYFCISNSILKTCF